MITTLLLASALLLGPTPPSDESAVVADAIVAGSEGDFMQVRHVVLRGSQSAIGAALTRIARQELGVRPWPSRDDRTTRLQARYFETAWPQQLARMRGSADAFGLPFDDTSVNFNSLAFRMEEVMGCSVVHVPPSLTKDERGFVSRNLDFTAGTMAGRRPEDGRLPAFSRPFVIESYPDEGYASLFTASNDLLGGAFDGINEHGLVAALLTDRELMNEHEMDPVLDHAVGFSELQVVRYLLETCRDIDEARDALLSAKHYFGFVPCHYLVADASGEAFVFELSATRNRSYFVEANGALVTTNFMLHRHGYGARVPRGDSRLSSFGRFHNLHDEVAAAGWLTPDDLKQLHRCAAFDGPAPPENVPFAPQRTMWHAVYLPGERSVEIDFYLGEDEGIRRSGYVGFALER